MTTVHLSVNSRVSYGDGAKESTVGTYRLHDLKEFNKALRDVVEELRREGWLTPAKRVASLRKLLARKGFKPLRTQEIFVSIH